MKALGLLLGFGGATSVYWIGELLWHLGVTFDDALPYAVAVGGVTFWLGVWRFCLWMAGREGAR